MHHGKGTRLEVLTRILVPLLALRSCVTLGKFLHLPGLFFLSCKCHATFGKFVAIFVGESALGSVIKERLLAS